MAVRGCVLVLFLAVTVSLASAAHANLREKYPFSVSLLNDASRGYYNLHWNFTTEQKTIYFAVNVSTTGWVGFGLSPTGGMVKSDVVIGWVDNGAVYFQDRYADAQSLPQADSSQDWCVTSAEEAGGYTILEFNRKFVTCDSRDRDITLDTARVVWSFNPNDPSGNDEMNLAQHSHRGAISVNLLGGDPIPIPQAAELFLDVTVPNVEIPTDPTTYLCGAFRAPSAFDNTTHYINRVSPVLTPHNREFVHHMIIYACPANTPISPEEVGLVRSCFQASSTLQNCLGTGAIIGGWAVGGSDVIFPEGTALPIGGEGREYFIAIEFHYDNPGQQAGIMDSSGMRFYYTAQEPTHRSGVLYLGANVDRNMFIPPGLSQFTYSFLCSAQCTSETIPEEGYKIYGNFFHTHLIGRSMTIRHFRFNTTTNQLVELEPLDQNLNYDFDFQQFVLYPAPRVLMPGDSLLVQCTYDSTTRDSVTYSGLGTREEMCISAMSFYPSPADGSSLIRCTSSVVVPSLHDFSNYIVNNNLTTSENLQSNYNAALDTLNWAEDSMLSPLLQRSVSNASMAEFCLRHNTSSTRRTFPMPRPDVQYQPPDVCTGVTSGQLAPTCLMDGDDLNISGAPPVASASLFLVTVVALLLGVVAI